MVSDINLFIPIEVKNREFYSKVLLARYAAERGFRVFLGRKSEINRLALGMSSGIYHGLSTAHNTSAFYEKLVKRGHRVSVNDEEGLVTFSDEMYLDLKVSQTTLGFVDRLFVWGREHYSTLASGRVEFTDNLRVSGNPRFDLLKPQFRGIYADEIKKILTRHSKLVLICMSFASCNHYIRGIDYLQSLIEKSVLRSPDSIAIYRRFQDGKIRAWHEFIRVIPLLARAYPDTHFVIRPHPSESDLPYRAIEAVHPNVFLDDEFSIHAWVLAAKAVIHHYCTSSVESFAAGTPGFALRPDPDPLVEKEIPYKCSRHCGSGEELIESLYPVLKGDVSQRFTLLVPDRDYSDTVHNIGPPVAAEVIATELAQLARRTVSGASVRNAYALHRERIRAMVVPFLKNDSTSHIYLSHKFDTITPAEVLRALSLLTFSNDKQFRVVSLGPMIVSVKHEVSR